MGCSSVGWLDSCVLGINHLYIAGSNVSPTAAASFGFDPEGMVTTLSAVLPMFLGLHIGHAWRLLKSTPEVMVHWAMLAAFCTVAGIFLSGWLPFNKRLWSLSYSLFTSGTAILMHALLYFACDVLAHRPTLWGRAALRFAWLYAPFRWCLACEIQKEGSTGTVQTEVRKIQMTVEVKSIEYDAAGNCIRYSGKNCEDMLFIGRASPGHVQSARVLLTLKTALREALPLQLRSPERQDWRVGCGRSGDSGSAVVPGHHAMQRKRFNHGNLEKLLVDLAERFPPSQEEVAVVLREEMELWHRTPKFATALLKALARRNLPSIATDVLAVMARQSVDSRLI
eukprot:s7878_g1.t3